MKIASTNQLLVAIVMCIGMSGYVQAQAPEVLNPPIKSEGKKKAKKAKAAKGSKAKFSSGSEETKKERDSRLKRECKGQTNAGACLGYTR
jgi:hypothetical protein